MEMQLPQPPPPPPDRYTRHPFGPVATLVILLGIFGLIIGLAFLVQR